jgi:hypothetical protein
MKFVLPAFWLMGFIAATALSFGGTLAFDPAPPPAMKWMFLAVTLAGAASLYWFCMRLKRVEMDDVALYVSNYLQETSVPLQDIDDVRENRWVNIRPVTVTFRTATDFGERVVFMPTTRWWRFWREHPVVDELRRAAQRARTQSRT